MFKIVQLKFQNLQLSFQNFTTPIAKFTTECSKFCLGGCGTPPHPPVQPPLSESNLLSHSRWLFCRPSKIVEIWWEKECDL